jgi:hypothetical protein
MRVNKNDIICGLPAKILRDILRMYSVSVRSIDDELNRHGYINSTDIINDLVTDGYLEYDGDDTNRLTRTVKGGRVAAANFLKPMTRKGATTLMSDVVKRASEYSDLYPENPFELKLLTVFGSYTTDANELGDLDLIADVHPKAEWDWLGSDACFDETKDQIYYFNELYAPVSLSYFAAFDYPATHIKRFLQKRNCRVSFCSRSSFEQFENCEQHKTQMMWAA